MKLNKISSLFALCVLLIGSSGVSAQTIINLTQDATVRSVGTYTYFARGDTAASASSVSGNIMPWTSKFYPRNTKDGSLTYNGSYGASSNAGAVNFSTGYLTDNNASTTVNGYFGQTQYVGAVTGAPTEQWGTFDLLFNLSAQYVITGVTVTYIDAAGSRIATTANAQQLYTSLTAPTQDSDLTLYGSSTAATSSGTGTFDFNGSTTAQYLDLRLDVRVSSGSGTGSMGASLVDVAIMGYAVPEPRATALVNLTLLGLCFYGGGRRLKSSAIFVDHK